MQYIDAIFNNHPITFSKNSIRGNQLQNRNFEEVTYNHTIMKNSNVFRKVFFAAIALMMTAGIYSCKSKETEVTETDMDTVRTVEEVETVTDTATIADDTLTPAP